MSSNYRIAILGIGGVGGYYAGMLAAHYHTSSEVEVVLVARGENARVIASNGLKLITPDSERVVHPFIVTNSAETPGNIDLLLCCVKSYDLESSLTPLASCITDKTFILPIINGLDNSERIQSLFPHANVLNGCVYIISRLIAPGVVKVNSKSPLIHFGAEMLQREKLEHIVEIFTSAGLKLNLANDIRFRMWEKFLFISPFATLTSYLNLPAGEIVAHPEHKELFLRLVTELYSLARPNGIHLPENSVEKIWERMTALPPDTTSSMHSDFQRGRETELSALTTYVVELGKTYHIETPTYEMMLKKLASNSIYQGSTK